MQKNKDHFEVGDETDDSQAPDGSCAPTERKHAEQHDPHHKAIELGAVAVSGRENTEPPEADCDAGGLAQQEQHDARCGSPDFERFERCSRHEHAEVEDKVRRAIQPSQPRTDYTQSSGEYPVKVVREKSYGQHYGIPATRGPCPCPPQDERS